MAPVVLHSNHGSPISVNHHCSSTQQFQGHTEVPTLEEVLILPPENGPTGAVPAVENHVKGAAPLNRPASPCSGKEPIVIPTQESQPRARNP